MIAGHSTRSDSSQFLLPIQGSSLQNRDHVACQYVHIVLYWSLAHNCHENQNDYIILLAAQVQCAEILKWPTYDSFDDAFGIVFPRSPSHFMILFLYALLLVMCATYSANINIYLIIEILLYVMYKLWRFSLCSFPGPSVTSPHLGASIFLSEYPVAG